MNANPECRNQRWPPRWLAVAVVLLGIFGITAAIRIWLLNMPLERDEGDFAYAAQLLAQGLSPYDWAYTAGMKLPGTFIMYALSMALFGQTPVAIHLGLLLVNIASAILVFFMSRRISGDVAALVAAGTFSFLSIVPMTLGLAAHATHFVMLPALAGILVLQTLAERPSGSRCFWAGLLLGLAFWMKQTGALFAVFAAAWILRQEFSAPQKRWPRAALRLALLSVASVIPLLVTFVVVAAAGDFPSFWFWAFTYNRAHATVLAWQSGMIEMGADMAAQFAAAPALWSMAIAGLVLTIARSSQPWRFFLISFAACSFLAVCPGWYFRNHYFIQLLPAAGLLAGVAYRAAADYFASHKFRPLLRAIPGLIFAVAGLSSLLQWNDVYFRLRPPDACRAIYGANPFPEAMEVAKYLAGRCPPDARIAVLGSEPEIFFYSHRRSATGHIDMYPLLENQPYAPGMRAQLIQEITSSQPAYVVYVKIPGSWIQSTANINNDLFDWFDEYRHRELVLVGLADIQPDQPTKFRWFDPPVEDAQPTSDTWLAIYKRRWNQ